MAPRAEAHDPAVRFERASTGLCGAQRSLPNSTVPCACSKASDDPVDLWHREITVQGKGRAGRGSRSDGGDEAAVYADDAAGDVAGPWTGEEGDYVGRVLLHA